MEKNVVQLFTPGLDSFLAYEFLKQKYSEKQIRRIYIDLKCRYSQYEIDFLRKLYSEDEVEVISNVVNLGKYEQENAHVPNRNLILVSVAQGLTNCDEIYINGVKDDRVSDNTFKFRETLSEHLSVIAEKEIRVKSVLEHQEKSEAVKKYTDSRENKSIDLLTKTFSCYNKELYLEENLSWFEKNETSTQSFDRFIEKGKVNIYGCLECVACYRKLCALTNANIYVPFFNYATSKQYNDSKMNCEMPNRIQTIKNYHQFLSWMGCD